MHIVPLIYMVLVCVGVVFILRRPNPLYMGAWSVGIACVLVIIAVVRWDAAGQLADDKSTFAMGLDMMWVLTLPLMGPLSAGAGLALAVQRFVGLWGCIILGWVAALTVFAIVGMIVLQWLAKDVSAWG